ncbi:2,3-diaminopropionate biosynthesis protein SbnB [Kitasatospora mediocidica]|uniref:2,3-diaminopropionate biosynthesis protein SbnB n=1 Tax=Kitasatospora mediocidica TaxID=58352 RepID=UPI00056835C4|nr:2,3-diaminopropionate biosynthesis protein SbnB [Kitasatospora mediocidica]
MFNFDVVSGTVARKIIQESRSELVTVVKEAYLTHYAGSSVNPNSYFLRFPENPSARIIALPAYLGGEYDVAGIKWISSFPENIKNNVPRASAVLLLNDYATGYPFACLEASQISAARTAASAVLGAAQLLGRTNAERITVVGSGIIARNIIEFFAAEDWKVGEFAIVDHKAEYAELLAAHVRDELGYSASRFDDLPTAFDGADVIVLATTAPEPYIVEPGAFAPGQVVLNISLRDISPDLVLSSHNVVDDVDHCLTANTSPHLAEQQTGNRDFISGVLAQVIRGEVSLDAERPRIFSPFGLGVLDLAVGSYIHRRAVESGQTQAIDGFFGETERWGK